MFFLINHLNKMNFTDLNIKQIPFNFFIMTNGSICLPRTHHYIPMSNGVFKSLKRRANL